MRDSHLYLEGRLAYSFGKNGQGLTNEFDIINGVYKIWYDKEFINDKMIIDSLKITGISVSLDGSENHLIKYHRELSDEIYIPSELLAESSKIINDYELDYANNHKFDTSSQESKDGLEDCMADPQMNTSIVQRIIEKFRKLFHHDKDDQQK